MHTDLGIPQEHACASKPLTAYLQAWQDELKVQVVKDTEYIKDKNVCPYRLTRKARHICPDL